MKDEGKTKAQLVSELEVLRQRIAELEAVTAIRDTAERQQTEERLRLQSAALEAVANGIVITDRDGIIKTTSGLLKLIYPHRTSDDLQRAELALCLDLATECRERVIDQLAIIAGDEFKSIKFDVLP